MADDQVVEIDEHGRIWLPMGDQAFGWFLHEGVRVRALPHPDDLDRAVVRFLGGQVAEPGYEEEGCAVSISARGLRELAAYLLKAANQLEGLDG